MSEKPSTLEDYRVRMGAGRLILMLAARYDDGALQLVEVGITADTARDIASRLVAHAERVERERRRRSACRLRRRGERNAAPSRRPTDFLRRALNRDRTVAHYADDRLVDPDIDNLVRLAPPAFALAFGLPLGERLGGALGGVSMTRLDRHAEARSAGFDLSYPAHIVRTLFSLRLRTKGTKSCRPNRAINGRTR
jgi:hypothetical protein